MQVGGCHDLAEMSSILPRHLYELLSLSLPDLAPSIAEALSKWCSGAPTNIPLDGKQLDLLKDSPDFSGGYHAGDPVSHDPSTLTAEQCTAVINAFENIIGSKPARALVTQNFCAQAFSALLARAPPLAAAATRALTVAAARYAARFVANAVQEPKAKETVLLCAQTMGPAFAGCFCSEAALMLEKDLAKLTRTVKIAVEMILGLRNVVQGGNRRRGGGLTEGVRTLYGTAISGRKPVQTPLPVQLCGALWLCVATSAENDNVPQEFFTSLRVQDSDVQKIKAELPKLRKSLPLDTSNSTQNAPAPAPAPAAAAPAAPAAAAPPPPPAPAAAASSSAPPVAAAASSLPAPRPSGRQSPSGHNGSFLSAPPPAPAPAPRLPPAPAPAPARPALNYLALLGCSSESMTKLPTQLRDILIFTSKTISEYSDPTNNLNEIRAYFRQKSNVDVSSHGLTVLPILRASLGVEISESSLPPSTLLWTTTNLTLALITGATAHFTSTNTATASQLGAAMVLALLLHVDPARARCSTWKASRAGNSRELVPMSESLRQLADAIIDSIMQRSPFALAVASLMSALSVFARNSMLDREAKVAAAGLGDLMQRLVRPCRSLHGLLNELVSKENDRNALIELQRFVNSVQNLASTIQDIEIENLPGLGGLKPSQEGSIIKFMKPLIRSVLTSVKFPPDALVLADSQLIERVFEFKFE